MRAFVGLQPLSLRMQMFRSKHEMEPRGERAGNSRLFLKTKHGLSNCLEQRKPTKGKRREGERERSDRRSTNAPAAAQLSRWSWSWSWRDVCRTRATVLYITAYHTVVKQRGDRFADEWTNYEREKIRFESEAKRVSSIRIRDEDEKVRGGTGEQDYVYTGRDQICWTAAGAIVYAE